MDLNKNIKNCPLIFLDLETTGLLVERSSICEVAAFLIKQGKIVDEFHSLVHPHQKVPYAAFCIHKISDKDLIGAPYFENIAGNLVNFLSQGILCAYNVAFDLGFINYQLKKNNREYINPPLIDVLAMAKNILKLKSYKLESVARFFGLTSKIQFHRAKDDAYVTYLIFSKLIEIIEKKEPMQAKEFINLYGL
ncbi:MAG: 3'-5' exonuclease [Candidatus Omnitrophica bacterium]|nr:3'-5' exonuclease [Candidatus Omnitrophota bacterium]MCF7894008.1 3'-5' exonuclease [Candidatus Omnitrophota bacterium]